MFWYSLNSVSEKSGLMGRGGMVKDLTIPEFFWHEMFAWTQPLNPKCESNNQGLILGLPKKSSEFLFLRSIMGGDRMRKETLNIMEKNGSWRLFYIQTLNILMVYTQLKDTPTCTRVCTGLVTHT